MIRRVTGDAALRISGALDRWSIFWRRVSVMIFTGKPWRRILNDEEAADMMLDPPFAVPPDVPRMRPKFTSKRGYT